MDGVRSSQSLPRRLSIVCSSPISTRSSLYFSGHTLYHGFHGSTSRSRPRGLRIERNGKDDTSCCKISSDFSRSVVLISRQTTRRLSLSQNVLLLCVMLEHTGGFLRCGSPHVMKAIIERKEFTWMPPIEKWTIELFEEIALYITHKWKTMHNTPITGRILEDRLFDVFDDLKRVSNPRKS